MMPFIDTHCHLHEVLERLKVGSYAELRRCWNKCLN